MILKIFSSLNNCDGNERDAEPVLGFPHSRQAQEAAQWQIPSTSFCGYFQSSHKGPKSPASSSVVQGKQGAISRDDSCRGLQPFRPPSPSPLMTAGLEWVGSYFWGHGEGSEVIWDESRLAGGSAVTTAGKVSPAQAGILCPAGMLWDSIHLPVTCLFLHGISIYLFLPAVTP